MPLGASPDYSGIGVMILSICTGIAAVIAALAAAVAAHRAASIALRAASIEAGVAKVNKAVDTMNELTMGQLSGRQETRRIEDIDPSERTEQEDRHITGREDS